jgi:hypothetical protein
MTILEPQDKRTGEKKIGTMEQDWYEYMKEEDRHQDSALFFLNSSFNQH